MQLTDDQVRKIADISADIAQIALGGIAVPFFLERYEPQLALIGLTLACIAWAGSVFLVKKATFL